MSAFIDASCNTVLEKRGLVLFMRKLNKIEVGVLVCKVQRQYCLWQFSPQRSGRQSLCMCSLTLSIMFCAHFKSLLKPVPVQYAIYTSTHILRADLTSTLFCWLRPLVLIQSQLQLQLYLYSPFKQQHLLPLAAVEILGMFFQYPCKEKLCDCIIWWQQRANWGVIDN